MFPLKLLPTALLALASVLTPVAAEEPLSMDIDTLYREPALVGTRPGTVAWSPDSARVAFAWNNSGGNFRDVWAWSPGIDAPLRLTRHDRPGPWNQRGVSAIAWADAETVLYVLDDALMRQSIGKADSSEVWKAKELGRLSSSPAGQYLAVTTGDGLWRLTLNDLEASPVQLLAYDDPANRISSLQWSADGRHIAFVQTDARPLPERDIHYYTREGHQDNRVRRAFPGQDTAIFRVGVVALESGDVTYLDRPRDTDYIWNYGISADGSRVFVNGSDLLVKHHRIDLYDVASGEREVFYQEHDPKHLRPDWRAAWAPGDQGLIILTDRDGFLHLYHQQDSESSPRQLTSGSWEISRFWVSQRDGWLYFLANRSHLADKTLYRVPFGGGDIQRITVGPGTHVPFFSPDMQQVVTLFSDDRTPHDLVHIDPATRQAQQVTRSPHADFRRGRWAEVRYVEFPSRKDGVNLVGRLSLPADFDPDRRYPLIVGSVYSDSVLNQWGGRQSHPTWGLDQALVAQGYILLNVNIRGSWGQGRKHNQGLRYGYGIVDIEDLHSGVEYLVKEGYADPERVGIWGSSYGGLMTMMSLFKKPGVYAAGIAGAPATNVAHAYPGQRWVMGEHTGEDQPGRYESQSPLYHSAGLKDPLMIIHGSRDQVVLYSDTIAVIHDLVDREQMFELVTLPGVGHGWDAEAPEVRRFAFKKMIDFFNRHLMK
ncbi:MAG: prolyl oligopeptidase family serine peptidase [Xanthomonadales bacterium]|nr:prolyl oligopeptidase family serine peptidase [Xanthomonadales bacterium]